eukprot:10277279-Alexandrium_andersonii.AAC.1
MPPLAPLYAAAVLVAVACNAPPGLRWETMWLVCHRRQRRLSGAAGASWFSMTRCKAAGAATDAGH